MTRVSRCPISLRSEHSIDLVKGKVTPVLSSTILELDAGGQFHAPVTLLLGIILRCPLVTRMCGPQNRTASSGEEKNLLPAGNRTLAVKLTSHRCTSYL
jgi:hypothetical protein